MGKKPFISKQNATKYDLVFKSSEDADAAPQREWIESDRKVGIGKPDLEKFLEEKRSTKSQIHPADHPLAWLQTDSDQPPLSEARRREIVSLGFPDDGYDYLKHIRQGHATSSQTQNGNTDTRKSDTQTNSDENGGPSVFIPAPDFAPPADDYKAIDACRLTIHQAAHEDEDAALVALGAKVFARELQTVRKRFQAEIDEMDDLIKMLDGNEKGEGDLLEDFVLTATEAQVREDEGDMTVPSEGSICQEESDLEEEDDDDDLSTDEDLNLRGTPSENKSFASTYWRPERTDRNANLSVIDERFEQLALEYDSDDIGELDQLAGDQSTRGFASTNQYSKIFDRFLTEHATKDHQFEGGQPYIVNQRQEDLQTEEEKKDADLVTKSIAMAKDHVRRLEEQEAEPRDPVEQNPYPSDDERRENWDCESVLTTRTTLYNHPQKLDALPPSRRPEIKQIRLSHKTGLPRIKQDLGMSQPNPPHPNKLPKAPNRKHDETTEDKKARKQAVKEAQREARAQKKEVKNLFKEEAQRQKKQSPNLQISVASMS